MCGQHASRRSPDALPEPRAAQPAGGFCSEVNFGSLFFERRDIQCHILLLNYVEAEVNIELMKDFYSKNVSGFWLSSVSPLLP